MRDGWAERPKHQAWRRQGVTKRNIRQKYRRTCCIHLIPRIFAAAILRRDVETEFMGGGSRRVT